MCDELGYDMRDMFQIAILSMAIFLVMLSIMRFQNNPDTFIKCILAASLLFNLVL